MSELALKLPAIRKIAAYTSFITLPLGLVTLSKFTFALAGVAPDEKGNAAIAVCSLFFGLIGGLIVAMAEADRYKYGY